MPLSLEPLGLGPRESRVYVRLVECGSAGAHQLADELGMPVDAVVASLEELTSRGLTHREGFQGCRFRVLSPRVALPEVIRARRLELNRLQDEADRICDEVDRRSGACGPGPGLVETVVGAAAIHDVCAQIQRDARHEVLMVDAPPYFDGGVQPNESEFAALSAGVAYRVIYHRDAVVTEEARHAMRRYVAAGEDARVHAQAWPKLIVVDGSVALVPESGRDPDPERRLLVRSSTVLELLTTHFEQMWERAIPVEALGRSRLAGSAGGAEGADGAENAGVAGSAEVSDRDRELLTLMAAGLKDRAIARSLGVTERTVSRRIQELMRRLDADTRFRAGIRAVQQGWVAG